MKLSQPVIGLSMIFPIVSLINHPAIGGFPIYGYWATIEGVVYQRQHLRRSLRLRKRWPAACAPAASAVPAQGLGRSGANLPGSRTWPLWSMKTWDFTMENADLRSNTCSFIHKGDLTNINWDSTYENDSEINENGDVTNENGDVTSGNDDLINHECGLLGTDLLSIFNGFVENDRTLV